MSEILLRCRQCGWGTEVMRERIPRYGARIRCPECGSLQPLAPTPEEPKAEPVEASGEEVVETPLEPNPDAGRSQIDPESTRGKARQILLLWLQELQRGSKAPLTATRLFREHGEDLAHLFSMWRASFPGGQATRVFREQLLEALERLDEPAP